eukprot:m.481372 g.481372  ORF g.481372 m.481372 type:complete len:175 (+) comp22145_c0_seq1:137-661(+)
MGDELTLHVNADEAELFPDDMDEGDDATAGLKSAATKRKGRGFGDSGSGTKFDSGRAGGAALAPQRSVEGWIVFVTGVHEEAQEEDLLEKFAEFGTIRNLALNLDRRTGFVKGYALIEYETHKEALKAIEQANGTELLGEDVAVSWAFVRGTGGGGGSKGERRRSGRRGRSPSP